MSVSNQDTIKAYDGGVERYIDGTIGVTSGFQKDWLDRVFADIPVDASILEIGSAFGRDAHYLSSKGYALELTDGSAGFVDYLRSEGFDVQLLNIVKDRPAKKYDTILACGVFLHFTDEDFQQAVSNVRISLRDGGRFAFSVKLGDGDDWSDEKMGVPRYFHYYQPDELERALARAEMSIVDMQVYEDRWICVISQASAPDGIGAQ